MPVIALQRNLNTDRAAVREAETKPTQRGQAALFNLTSNRMESHKGQCVCQTIIKEVTARFARLMSLLRKLLQNKNRRLSLKKKEKKKRGE